MRRALLFVLVPLIVAYSCLNYSPIQPYDDDEDPSNTYIAVFGDIQYLTNRSHLDTYVHSVNWILDEMIKGRHFNSVLHTGDITENNSVDQWKCFLYATRPIARRIPYISLIGNHDYTWEGSLITDRQSTHFNDYVKFPLTTRRVVASFEEGRMENIVVRNEIYGQRYDFLLLEFGPRVEVVEWASEWVSTHPDIKYILMNHEYLEAGGGRRTKGLKCKSQLRNTSYVTPDELWDKLIRCNDNIVCVLCGHVGGLYAVTYDENDFGREVCQIQHNIQGSEYRFDNWLMLWDFPSECDSVSVSIINTKTGKLYDDADCLFKFRYRY